MASPTGGGGERSEMRWSERNSQNLEHLTIILWSKRWDISKYIRFCPFCWNQVEHKINFIVGCPIYKNLWKPLTHSPIWGGGGWRNLKLTFWKRFRMDLCLTRERNTLGGKHSQYWVIIDKVTLYITKPRIQKEWSWKHAVYAMLTYIYVGEL